MNQPLVLLLATFSLAISACGGTTDPQVTVVRIDLVELVGPTTGVDENGDPTVSCEIALSAVGEGDGAARWLDATLRTFAVGDPSTRVETARIDADLVREVWGFEWILPGETQTSRWLATKGAPFSATLDFRYQRASGAFPSVSSVAFTCSP
jgi:hypothetical protein